MRAQGLEFSVIKSTREITASYTSGEIEVQLRIKIPSEYPMKSVEVECSKQLRIQERQLKKWILSIRKLLSSQNGDILGAVMMWKSNIDKEIAGAEDCLICYCVVQAVDRTLPRLVCKHCKNKYGTIG